MQTDFEIPTTLEAILRVQQLSVSYNSIAAIQGINMEIYKNQVTGFIGPSGCGKTTLLRCFNRINDLVKNAKITGKITFYDRDIQEFNLIEVRRRIGMVFQKPNPFPKSIYENIALGLRVNGYRGNIDELVEDALRQTTLWDEVKDRLNKNAMTLSGGQQQRLCIARALALQPEVILMDEPCSALDPVSTLRIEELIQKLKKHYTIVIVTHNLQQASRVSDLVAFFNIKIEKGSRVGELVEYASAPSIFLNPKQKTTSEYVGTYSRIDSITN
ncbi:MAG: phosphate ABC transporter ATP-binding protein PstB [Oscillatoriaceae cyanobacterium Prado104]|jgi:phosphate transport system ATP-binding protein|nr:phosphate ABC transporter ATP-binding protein PstB [Oscillatoriaceae cyanobacterium Prado104]